MNLLQSLRNPQKTKFCSTAAMAVVVASEDLLQLPAVVVVADLVEVVTPTIDLSSISFTSLSFSNSLITDDPSITTLHQFTLHPKCTTCPNQLSIDSMITMITMSGEENLVMAIRGIMEVPTDEVQAVTADQATTVAAVEATAEGAMMMTTTVDMADAVIQEQGLIDRQGLPMAAVDMVELTESDLTQAKATECSQW